MVVPLYQRFHPPPPAVPKATIGGSFGRCHHARAPGGRSPLRSPDPPLGSQDAPLYLRRARRHLHHRPRADAPAPGGGGRVRAEPRRAGRHDALRRHEEAGPGLDRAAREAGRDAVREPPLARRPAHELAHGLGADGPPARAAPPERRGAARAAPAEGADLDARRAGAPGEPSRRRRRHEEAARRGAGRRPAQGGDRRARGPAPRPARRGARGHELRSRRGRLRRPGQRRRDQVLRPLHRDGRGRDGGRQAEGEAGGVRAAGGSRAGAGGSCGGDRSRAGGGGPGVRGARSCGGGGPGRMTEVTADMVRQLREMTGAPMMDTKRALVDAEGDLDAAKQLLRERGMASAGKRAGNETPEGVVLTRLDDSKGTIVAVGSETEPVSKNDEFRAFAEKVLDTVEKDGPDAVESLEEERKELVGKIGENIIVRGAAQFGRGDGDSLAAYVHPPANKIGVLVKAEGSPEAARRLAMHIAFAAPRFATRDEVPEEEVVKEREIYEKLPEVESKPEQAREKIVEGMLGKRFFAENVLAEQAWIHEPKKTVAQALEEEGLTVLEFERYALAE